MELDQFERLQEIAFDDGWEKGWNQCEEKLGKEIAELKRRLDNADALLRGLGYKQVQQDGTIA